MTKLYYRLTKTFSDIGKLIPIEDNIYDHIDDLSVPWFKSIYFYTEEQKEQAEEIIQIGDRKRARGISGIVDVVTNKVVFDFDDAEDIEKARNDAITVCERLSSHGIKEDNIQICFSGKKGFAIEVVFEDTWFKPQEMKNIVNELAHDLETFDAVVVNASRIFRVPLTKHNDTEYYKIPLCFAELKGCEISEIKEIAKCQYDTDSLDLWTKTECPETFHNIKEIAPELPKATSVVAGKEHNLDFSKMPKGFTKWKYAILNGYFPVGTRSVALTILASTLRYLGYPEKPTYYMLKSAADAQSERFGVEKFSKEDIWKTIMSQVFGPQWRGACYSEENFPPELQKYLLECGIPRSRKETNSGLKKVGELFGSFEDFAENIEKNTIKTGIDAIDKNTRITTGMLFGLLAGAGGGKTSVALSILNQCSLNNEEAIFFSMDMNSNLIYQKLGQKHTGLTGEEIFEIFKVQDIAQKKSISEKINKNYANVGLDFRTALQVEEMKNEIIDYEESTGKKVKLVVVDYLECIVGPYSDPTANGGFVANALKDLASDLDVCVLLLLQTQKASGDVSEPLRSMRKVKGSSVLEQACSIIISLWREGFDPRNFDNDKFMTFCCVKNRMGKLFEVDCGWEGLTGEVLQLPENEKEELEDLRKAKLQAQKIADL